MIRRLFSKTIREAVTMRKHVQRLLNAQRDLLGPQAIGAVQAKILELNEAVDSGANTGKIRIKTEELQFAAEKWIKSYPNPVWRENVEVLLVAIAVAMGIRTFFLQPFKIPTGSMQPTLYGVTSTNLIADKNFQIPGALERFKEWFQGISYIHVVAPADGRIDGVGPMDRFLIFNLKQTISIGGVQETIWFPPDLGEAPPGADPLLFRAGFYDRTGHLTEHYFHKGEDLIKLRVHAGDHLFVDRFTYNFRRPERGEIVVFETAGIPEERREAMYPPIPPNEFYIKRLCGLGGETIWLNPDYEVIGSPQSPSDDSAIPVGNLIVNGKAITASTPHFENLYTFYDATNGTKTLVYHANHYYGHALLQELAQDNKVQIPPNHLFVMGDNTFDSLDSRYWGDFPEKYVIGRSFFVYWPITKRFGLDDQ